MTKVATIASLVRAAASGEDKFVTTIEDIFAEGDIDRISEFFDRLNIPRSTGAEAGLQDDLPTLGGASTNVTDFQHEKRISAGMQKYMDRHERKIKWHSTHPSIEGTENVLLVFRGAMMITNLRLERLIKLLASVDEMSPVQWAIARELMNRSYLSFRNFLVVMGSNWVDAAASTLDRDEFAEKVGNFYELIDLEIRVLEEYRNRVEDRRLELTVLPEGYPPVKPPHYFGGDLLSRGPWKQYWGTLNTRAHHFRETAI